MGKIPFMKKMRDQSRPVGMIVTIPHPAIAEIAARSGFDWLFIDGEHSSLGYTEVESILAVTPAGCSGIVRVPKLDEIWTKKVLDSGADGVIFPQINNAGEAALAVRYCNYPTDGDRSTGVGKAHNYGFSFSEYLSEANERIAVIIQVEQKEGVENIESICAVPGVDALFIGPYDLSASLGVTGEVDHPAVQEGIARIRKAAERKKLPVGIFAMNAAKGREYLDKGFEYVAVGVDFMYFSSAAGEAIKQLKPELR